MDTVELANERLVLRPAAEHDLDFNFELRNRPEILALPGCETRPRSEVANQLRGWLERWDEIGLGRGQSSKGRPTNVWGESQLDPIGPGWAGLSPEAIEVGFVVHPAHWSRGIATEATLFAIADCFDRVGLDRLVAVTTVDNKPSLRVLEKVGMQRCRVAQHEDEHTTYELFELTPAPQEGPPTRRVTFPHAGPSDGFGRTSRYAGLEGSRPVSTVTHPESESSSMSCRTAATTSSRPRSVAGGGAISSSVCVSSERSTASVATVCGVGHRRVFQQTAACDHASRKCPRQESNLRTRFRKPRVAQRPSVVSPGSPLVS